MPVSLSLAWVKGGHMDLQAIALFRHVQSRSPNQGSTSGWAAPRLDQRPGSTGAIWHTHADITSASDLQASPWEVPSDQTGFIRAAAPAPLSDGRAGFQRHHRHRRVGAPPHGREAEVLLDQAGSGMLGCRPSAIPASARSRHSAWVTCSAPCCNLPVVVQSWVQMLCSESWSFTTVPIVT